MRKPKSIVENWSELGSENWNINSVFPEFGISAILLVSITELLDVSCGISIVSATTSATEHSLSVGFKKKSVIIVCIIVRPTQNFYAQQVDLFQAKVKVSNLKVERGR